MRGRAGEQFQRVKVTSAKEWDAWLRLRHRQTESVWVVSFTKKQTGYVPLRELVRTALALGVDGQSAAEAGCGADDAVVQPPTTGKQLVCREQAARDGS